ncbi:MAG TPA: ABC transporter ATP-binding protein [Gemmatimonadota bacterium]|nr:ABC transporter ATP-binding protein [Gemmatimonadota bacterium]
MWREGDIAIEVEGLAKRYRLGVEAKQHDTLVGTVGSWITAPVHNYRRLRRLSRFSNDEASDVLWALRDVSFRVKRGEVVGVIGGNGAGKSTLLKILSSITDPTAGRARLNGRVASLLEVGIGFHQELTGRENVYLNGTILGMRKFEIDRKYEEIVEFAGIEKFMDTPVKRFSSGMGVRLAFAVAAHLEPEILLVDEVLAVGDAAFQEKCLRKMDSIVHGGRTILFVSHDMKAIQQLCPRVIVLENGRKRVDGDAATAIHEYLSEAMEKQEGVPLAVRDRERPHYGEHLRVRSVGMYDSTGRESATLRLGEAFSIEVEFDCLEELSRVSVNVGIDTEDGIELVSAVSEEDGKLYRCPSGDVLVVRATFDDLALNVGAYHVRVGARTMKFPLDFVRDALSFQVLDALHGDSPHSEDLPGLVRCIPKWSSHRSEGARRAPAVGQ